MKKETIIGLSTIVVIVVIIVNDPVLQKKGHLGAGA